MTKHIHPSLPNIAVLRADAISLSKTPADVQATLREQVALGCMLRREAKSWNSPLISYIEYDLSDDGLEIPKYTALASWLAPYSLVSQYPNAIVRVARFLLGHTYEAEMAAIDWVEMKKHFPEL